ncbi:MAG: xanthine dehydrogenase family protein molybdopterin-binding subunit [Betaproteobacteria bacterium]|nr:xanthine dehydrogenase family protein molybdopterin-binding subunit [Betaproteobacteria bacterium]
MKPAAQSNYVGRSMLRREDARLLRGKGQYVDDLELPGMLHVVFVRSTAAHARIKSVDLSQAAEAAGVHFVMSGIELARELPPVQDQQLPLPKKWRTSVPHKVFDPRQPLLAWDKVRHVGEAVAVIVAESAYLAEDAAELVQIEYEFLPAVVDVEQALAATSAVLHEKNGTNLLAEFSVGKGDVAKSFATAPRTLKRRFRHHRYAGVPMECRGVAAMHEPRTDAFTIWSSTQVVHWVRREAALTLGIAEARVRCIALDVGGGFGTKGHVYPEDLIMPFLARRIGRPVKWIEDRREHLQSACHSRDQIHEAEVAFDATGRILAFRDRMIMDCGAWNPVGIAIPYNTASHLMGPYKIEHFAVDARIVVTNKVPNAPYRGAGRPEAAQVMERMMDLIAREVGIEPAEVRRRNLIGADEMPYPMGIPYRDGEPIVYDTGDYPRALEQALTAVGGLEAFRVRQQAARTAGRRLGIGVAMYTEGTGVGPFEGATLRIDPSGKIYLSSGSCPQGQGMETIFAQIAADQWRVKPEDVVLAFADTSVISMGFGTLASRSTVNLSAAIHVASERLKKKVFALASHVLECSPGDLELRDGKVSVVGVPGVSMTLTEVARAARPGPDSQRPKDMDAGLEETYYWEPSTVTWSYAAHAVIVEIDMGIGHVRLERYAIAHDCGVVVNPLLAEGQIIGGAVQGIGGAMLEGFTYDREGQLLNASMMDYLLPNALDVPRIKVAHQESPSLLNPLGVKGLGEGGAIAPPVAIANAVCDALTDLGVEFNRTPITPEDMIRALRKLPIDEARVV